MQASAGRPGVGHRALGRGRARWVVAAAAAAVTVVGSATLAGASGAVIAIPPGRYAGTIDVNVSDALGSSFGTTGTGQGEGSGTIDLSADQAKVTGQFAWNATFVTQVKNRGGSGRGTYSAAVTGALSGGPGAVSFSNTGHLTGVVHENIGGVVADQPVDVTSPFPGGSVQIVAANCDEVDGSFAPALKSTAESNGLVVKQLVAQFAAFRNGNRIPPSLEAKIQALYQRVHAFDLAFIGAHGDIPQAQYIQQVGELIAAANTLYTSIYDLIADAGCDASGSWGNLLIPTIDRVLESALGQTRTGAHLNADQLHAIITLAFETGAITPQNISDYQADPNATNLRASDYEQVVDLSLLHRDLSDLFAEATANPAQPDVASLRDIYATAQMANFTDLVQESARYA